jgi:hypothetical protein
MSFSFNQMSRRCYWSVVICVRWLVRLFLAGSLDCCSVFLFVSHWSVLVHLAWRSFACCLAVGAAFALRVFITWDSHVLIVTNRRIVHVEQTGVWRRYVREMPLSALEQVSIERRGPWDALFRTGVLRLRANGHGMIVFAGAHRPEVLVEIDRKSETAALRLRRLVSS